jgi:hypothetical protein
LSAEAIGNVGHYISVGEIEVACESLILSIVEEGAQLTADLKVELLDLCYLLGLNENAVFRSDFWSIAFPVLSAKV